MKIIISVLLFISLNSLSFAQTSKDLFSLYQEKNFELLKKQYKISKNSLSKAEQLFLETVFQENAQVSYKVYKNLFENGSGQIKYFSGERLKDYYYAKGYYSTSSDCEKYLVENRFLIEEKEISSLDNQITNNVQPPDTEELFIQVGAFGLKENANQMREMLSTQKVHSKIITRVVRAKKLYCVWVIGKKSFKNTLKLANELKEKYHLDYKIIKE